MPEKPNAERLRFDATKFEMEWHEKWCRETAGTRPLRYDAQKAFHNAIYEAGYQAALQAVPSAAGQPSLEKLRELEALRDEMWKASDNRFAANYAIQTPGEFAGYVIPADKAQEWADRLRAVLAEFEKEGK